MTFSQKDANALVEAMRELWGTEDLAALVSPAMTDDELFVQENARQLRASATPRNAAAQYDHILRRDARTALAAIQTPTLVLHTRDNPIIPASHGRYIAERIEGARFVEVPGVGIGFDDGATTQVLTELSEFLTGTRTEVESERVLATVLFTDIVGSTDHLVQVGEQSWRTLLDNHDRVVREQLNRFGGQEVQTTGDGFFAAFDSAARAVRCAGAITRVVQPLGLHIRAGLHIGMCELRRGDPGGLTVHIAARVGALAQRDEVLVTSEVKDTVGGSGLDFIDRGPHTLKGVPDTWQLHALRDVDMPRETAPDPT